jgi:hypothetical protein
MLRCKALDDLANPRLWLAKPCQWGATRHNRTRRKVAMTAEFGRLVDAHATAQGWNDYQLQGAIGLLPGRKSFHARQVGRLRAGSYRYVDAEVVERLIAVLGLDPDEAWAAARPIPGLTPDKLRELGLFAAARASLEVGDDTMATWSILPGHRHRGGDRLGWPLSPDLAALLRPAWATQ